MTRKGHRFIRDGLSTELRIGRLATRQESVQGLEAEQPCDEFQAFACYVKVPCISQVSSRMTFTSDLLICAWLRLTASQSVPVIPTPNLVSISRPRVQDYMTGWVQTVLMSREVE